MTDVQYVTPAQVLAAQLSIELAEEAGEVPDAALRAIAQATMEAPSETDQELVSPLLDLLQIVEGSPNLHAEPKMPPPKFRTDEPSVRHAMARLEAEHAMARREAEHELEIEILKQNLRELQESHNKALVSARVEMYRNIIGRGDIDQFALQLAERPEDVASVVQLMREEREQTRMRITDFVLQMLNSGAIERWEIDDQVRTALSWLKESTEKIIASPRPNQIPATPAGGSGPVATELPGGAELPRATIPGQEAGQASPSSDDTGA